MNCRHVGLSCQGPSAVVEAVHPVAEQRHVGVHPRSVDAEYRLRHERRVQPVGHRHVLHDEPERRDVVGGRQHAVVVEVDFVLAGGDLVMRRLDVETHRFEREHDLAPHVLALVDRRQVEVAPGIVRLGRRGPVPPLEQEELALGAGVHREPLRGGERDDPLERAARAALERDALGRIDVADHPRHLLTGRVVPGIDHEGVGIRTQEHVRFLDPHEALDRRAVEHDQAVQRVLELAVRNLDVLDRAEDVGELQPHELDLLALGPLEDAGVLFREVRCRRGRCHTAPSIPPVVADSLTHAAASGRRSSRCSRARADAESRAIRRFLQSVAHRLRAPASTCGRFSVRTQEPGTLINRAVAAECSDSAARRASGATWRHGPFQFSVLVLHEARPECRHPRMAAAGRARAAPGRRTWRRV